jgi:hypothetical protein
MYVKNLLETSFTYAFMIKKLGKQVHTYILAGGRAKRHFFVPTWDNPYIPCYGVTPHLPFRA